MLFFFLLPFYVIHLSIVDINLILHTVHRSWTWPSCSISCRTPPLSCCRARWRAFFLASFLLSEVYVIISSVLLLLLYSVAYWFAIDLHVSQEKLQLEARFRDLYERRSLQLQTELEQCAPGPASANAPSEVASSAAHNQATSAAPLREKKALSSPNLASLSNMNLKELPALSLSGTPESSSAPSPQKVLASVNRILSFIQYCFGLSHHVASGYITFPGCRLLLPLRSILAVRNVLYLARKEAFLHRPQLPALDFLRFERALVYPELPRKLSLK